jgi:hypothetical protein
MRLVNTPWGESQESEIIAPGIHWHSTASHGGIKLSPERNARVPEVMRNLNGWYEEDIEAAIVMVVFPEEFDAEKYEAAKDALRHWKPLQYEFFFGETIPPGGSKIKDQWQFNVDHENDFVVLSAFGDWMKGVPKGYVGVAAARGGRRADWQVRGEVRYYLVPAWEYAEDHPFGFVIDESRHERVAEIGY